MYAGKDPTAANPDGMKAREHEDGMGAGQMLVVFAFPFPQWALVVILGGESPVSALT